MAGFHCAQKPIGSSRQQCSRWRACFFKHSHEARPPVNIPRARDPCERGCPTRAHGASQHAASLGPASASSSSKRAAHVTAFPVLSTEVGHAKEKGSPLASSLFASSKSWSVSCRRRARSAALSREASVAPARRENQIDIHSRGCDVRRSTRGQSSTFPLDTSTRLARDRTSRISFRWA